jgi:hypothetical protein
MMKARHFINQNHSLLRELQQRHHARDAIA